MMFKSEVGRELTAENLHFIAEKLFNSELSVPFTDPNNLQQVTWHDFCKKKITDRSFTFWEWFYSNLKLIKEYASVAWNSGYVDGFISKVRAEEKLRNSPHGTFLLRFSDSVKGSISIAYTMKSASGKSSVMHVNPFTCDDLRIHSLCDRLHGFNELKTLYPNIEKKEAFVSHKSNVPTWRSGYLMPVQTTRLPSYDEVNYSSYSK
jgi:signal transducer and activator of transcription 5B